MIWVMKLAIILFIGGIIGFLIAFFWKCDDSNTKQIKWNRRIIIGFAIATLIGFILEMLFIFVLDDTEYDSDGGGDDYKYSPQYYEDAYEYYKDNDNWNRDYGDKYGYR